jgi:hypothetical protein
MRSRRWLPWLLLASACAPGTGRQPTLSAGSHAIAAEGQDDFNTSESRKDPDGLSDGTPCGEPVCWTTTSNPTLEQAEQMAELRNSAAMFRERGRALGDAEERACAGLEPQERDVSPFYHRDDIVSVRTSSEKARTGKGSFVRAAGARVEFRAVPGLTAERLRLEVSCQMARAAAAGYDMPEASYCPLWLSGIEAAVFDMGRGFAVEITAEDAQTVEEILRRAFALLNSRDPLIFVPE